MTIALIIIGAVAMIGLLLLTRADFFAGTVITGLVIYMALVSSPLYTSIPIWVPATSPEACSLQTSDLQKEKGN
jgi:hypothetical protein